MEPRSKSPFLRSSASEQAAAWFARQRSGSWSESDAAEFAAWLKTDSSCTTAWASYQKLWDRLEVARDHPAILAVREGARRHAARRRALHWSMRAGGVLAASLIIAISTWRATRPPISGGWIGGRTELAAPAAAPLVWDASTQVGQRSVVVLADGSKVTLNTASAIHADYSGRDRRVTLVRGEAFFSVAKNADRPFIVSAGARQVIAVGTAFDVRLQGPEVKVILVEGKVRVLHTPLPDQRKSEVQPSPPVTLLAGSALLSLPDGADVVEHLNVEMATSWRTGKLIFDGEPLADVIAEMNRYSHEQLEIADRALGQRKISGVFEPTGGAAFAHALAAYGIARVSRSSSTVIVLKSP